MDHDNNETVELIDLGVAAMMFAIATQLAFAG